MKHLRFIMVGGFLGAGKTTTLSRLAKFYTDQGKRVGIVTNDQADNLVDTFNLREQGFAVEEVAGACFCCKFDDLMDKVQTLQESDTPDVLLAEPVGSCTDLVATVVQPLKDLYGDRFTVAPYIVLFKPSHGRRILANEEKAGFSPKAAYIFRKQLEEADAILINRIDELDEEAATELVRLVTTEYSGTPVLRVSAKDGSGFDGVTELLDQDGDFGRKILDIDYDTYAEGEAELGWLNCSAHVKSDQAFALDDLLVDIVRRLHEAVQHSDGEVAHLKAIGLWEGFFGVANLVANASEPELSLPSHCRVKEIDLIVNARVAMDPEALKLLVEQAIDQASSQFSVTSEIGTMQSFRPGRPVPIHRYPAK